MTGEAHTNSYYAATAKRQSDYPALREDASCDVCVIGGGYSGLSSALHLAERGYDVMLLEANRIGWGASGRNGGQVGSGQRQEQDVVEEMVGKADAQRLWDLAEESKAVVKSRIAKHSIDCDLKPGILHAACKPGDASEFPSYVDKLAHDYNYPHLRAVPKAEIREMLGTTRYHGGILDSDSAHLHPLNYALGLAQAADEAGARLFEGARVTAFQDGSKCRIECNGYSVNANHVVLACNGYLDKLEPRMAGKIMPINNFILATEPLGEVRAREIIRDDVAVADTKFVIDYYRLSADGRLLFGGGENYSRHFPKDIAGFVRKYMLRVYPQLETARIDYAWGGTLAITLNRMPDFGRLSPNVYYAQGFSGHGVAMASLAGKVIAEAVAGTAERFDVFERIPTRRFPGGTLLRWPGLVLGMMYYALRDKL
ncbi:FAD-binding oxidoreductase [Pelagibius sp. Alg239-R121]|uniref:NAD(P)/FAD-dependent oxidoreductase n=1 Tax=Pelagibius sp. Alg239-R121 TaxID=2993448 RepID=UPI0024A738F4|nr:FAD-binding oxidoreductase [Pelagibius sp. Alg239-R121]